MSGNDPPATDSRLAELVKIYDDPNYGGGDDLKTYMSMRDIAPQTRQAYLESLGQERQERLKHEIERIRKLRVKFFANPTKKTFTTAHQKRKKDWREEAKINQANYLKDIEERTKILDGKEAEGKNVAEERDKLSNEDRIVKAIANWPEDESSSLESHSNMPTGKPDYGLKACIMHFKKGGGGHNHVHKHKKVVGVFPNQKISVDHLLTKSEDNPLNEDCPPDRLRYFHLPTNNMAWVEQVLANYYDEDVSDHDPNIPPYMHGPAKRLLAREYWKGQMHGGSDHPVHARHMRHRFSSISSKVARTTISRRTSTLTGLYDQTPPSLEKPVSKSSQNFALFMPYLHWETNSRRSKMAEVVNELAKTNKNPKNEAKPETKEKARADFFHAVEQEKLQAKYNNKNKKPRTKYPSKYLGAYLMSIAKLYDEMDYEADERLLRDHLHQTPPLHIRRTLDQSYFWTLEDTTSRDKDQVVYRGTKAGKNWNARVVMVDQLWLWILDEHTILTSFPRRWGRNKPDPSGVHKSLRERLSHLEDDRINSVFDLALIIIDQCSRVFFDRTKPIDQRPEVMDIFSNTIAHVTGMKTIAYETFWSQMRLDSLKDPLAQSENSAIRAYLNVNPEGALLRECQDIVEELRMMSRIFTQQSQVVKDFKKALEKMTEKDGRRHGSAASFQNLLEDPEGESHSVPKSTIINAAEVLEHILERLTEIDELEEAAKRTSQQLQDLLTLKQQQASIIEARMALKRADLSIQQNRSIMLFTIVTIFFLPLSFFTSIFGMNNREWGNHPLSIHTQFRFMFPVSFAVITFSLLIAFSVWTRSLFNMAKAVITAIIVQYSPLPWIQELQWLSSQKFAEIEWKATKKIEYARKRRQDRMDKMEDLRRAKRDEEKTKEVEKQRSWDLKTAERQMSADGKKFAWVRSARRRTERWRGGGGGSVEATETFEEFGKA